MSPIIDVIFQHEVKDRFPGLKLGVVYIAGVSLRKSTQPGMSELEGQVHSEITKKYTADDLKSESLFRAYRDFFWKIDIDPTKTRPAAEALIRRILRGKDIPHINPAVDAYNLASIKTGIPLAAFNADLINGDVEMRFAGEGELFTGIGMKEPISLRGREIVLSDREKLIAIYPYRDADSTKLTPDTENILLLSCGVPNVTDEKLREALDTATDYITRFCSGKAEHSAIVG